MTSLETIFGELGISQYLDAFIDQGFDSWDTILDITESDLDALGVKLGHRRPDENAPERPPSAYVLFSNMGENWQNLTRAEKEPFETQAQEAKENYNRDLTEYKKTESYRKYNEYLHEFRKRQAAQVREKDVAKRLKTDSDSARGSSIGGGSGGPSGTASGAVSGSESQHGNRTLVYGKHIIFQLLLSSNT
ncbi:putative hmg box protein [Eutypa lata UCREL1]|uniref:Putative hmg box protein n=1 Tax=Eutypa lata (strain UCR-EL1) TaxID=1287681 RepID=M7SSQ0_EUTLA|nr:putative hmg box protein [Eutypa lata UCREL1]